MEHVRMYLPAVFLAPIAVTVALSLVYWAKLAFEKLKARLGKPEPHAAPLSYPVLGRRVI
jgi:hypothetical protein